MVHYVMIAQENDAVSQNNQLVESDHLAVIVESFLLLKLYANANKLVLSWYTLL